MPKSEGSKRYPDVNRRLGLSLMCGRKATNGLLHFQVCLVRIRVGSWRGSGFDDADVSSLPPIIPYSGFSPVRLEEEVPISQM